MKILFCCAGGLGNRMNNLINLYFLQLRYKNNANYYVQWIEDNHCSIGVDEIFDVKSSFDYEVKIFKTKNEGDTIKHARGVRWASTSTLESTQWDDINNWGKYNHVTSISHILFRFCTIDNVRFFLQKKLTWMKSIIEMVDTYMMKYNITYDTISMHFRFGDLFEVLSNHHNLSLETKHKECLNIISKYSTNDNNVFLCSDSQNLVNDAYKINDKIIKRYDVEYPTQIEKIKINRNRKSMINACVDMIILSKTKMSVFMPYSTFSIIAFLSNEQCNKHSYNLHGNDFTPKIVILS